jgi:hypothetical protein
MRTAMYVAAATATPAVAANGNALIATLKLQLAAQAIAMNEVITTPAMAAS